MKNYRYLIVGGTFSENQPYKQSNYIWKFSQCFKNLVPHCEIQNAGSKLQLEETINKIHNYDVVIWFPNIPNTWPKYIREIKQRNPKCILVSSKRNNNEYDFMEVIARALQTKSNLIVEFSKKEKILANIFDPLGNCFGNQLDNPTNLAIRLFCRIQQLLSFTRQGSSEIDNPFMRCCDNDIEEFLKICSEYAKVFHKLIHGVNNSRFLGNISFRCEKGFPSFKKQRCVFVSKRNIDKREISKDGFVPVKLKSTKTQIQYWGEHKPSVDTPIQLRLYKYFHKISMMLHSHVYISDAPMTDEVIPCGALEEFPEIMRKISNPDLESFQINLKGHGSIVAGNCIEHFQDIPYYARPMPEYQ